MELNIVDKTETEVEISIEGYIGWDDEGSWRTIKKKLADVASSKAKKIIVNINSLGGFVSDGLMIHDALKMSKAKVETRVYSMTASAATVIAQAGDKRKMSANALYLIHHAMNVAVGNVNDITAALEDLKTVDERLFDLYVKRGGNEAKVIELMAENNGQGKWIDAEEALEAGLIDEIMEPSRAAAVIDKEILAKYNLPLIPEKYMNDKTFFDKVTDFIMGTEPEEVVEDTPQEVPEEVITPEPTEEVVPEEPAVEDVPEPEEQPEETDERDTQIEALRAEVETLRGQLTEKETTFRTISEELSKARTALVKATAKGTEVKGRIGGEDDDIENVKLPFAEEVKAFDNNFMLGKPLDNPTKK